LGVDEPKKLARSWKASHTFKDRCDRYTQRYIFHIFYLTIVICADFRQRIVSGAESFQSMAIKYSDCETAKFNGYLGEITRNQQRVSKTVEEVAFNLQVSQFICLFIRL
jgi:hypothetical protein